MSVVEDPQWSTIQIAIYNAPYNFITKDQWLVIKEPYFKRAMDGSEIIRVDVPEDVEFLNLEP